jgi:septin family protein
MTSRVNEILEYIEANSRRLRELSLRMVKKIADLVNMDPTGWRDYADQTCLKGR